MTLKVAWGEAERAVGQTTRSPVVGMWGLVVGRYRLVVVGRKVGGSWVGVWVRGRAWRWVVETW